MPSSNKSWVYRFSLNGKPYKMTLGKYPGTTLKQARDLQLSAMKIKEQNINHITHAAEKKFTTKLYCKKSSLSLV